MQLNIQIQDDKASAFMDMLNSLDFVISVEKTESDAPELTATQEKILDERLRAHEAGTDTGKKPWREFRAEIEQRYDL